MALWPKGLLAFGQLAYGPVASGLAQSNGPAEGLLGRRPSGPKVQAIGWALGPSGPIPLAQGLWAQRPTSPLANGPKPFGPLAQRLAPIGLWPMSLGPKGQRLIRPKGLLGLQA